MMSYDFFCFKCLLKYFSISNVLAEQFQIKYLIRFYGILSECILK